MSSDLLALSLRDVSKTYRIAVAKERHTLFGEALAERLRRPFRRAPKEDFEALVDISLDVHQAETVGIIGRNGAGKSTLLKILSRIVDPTAGRIEVYGRLGSLLEVGTGFHPELTGRENIYLNGAILGMKRREINRQFESIVEFAEVDRFLDTPVKRYSSGMYVRLAFAVAAHLNPEILLVDEVLAVGDAQFQKKCLGKMDEVATKEGRTVLFVSHNMVAVQSLCRRCVYLEDGRVAYDGDTAEAIGRYLAGSSASVKHGSGIFALEDVPRTRSGSKQVLRRMELRGASGEATDTIPMGGPLSIAIDIEGLSLPRQIVAVRIVTETDVPIVTMNTLQRPLDIYRPDARQEQLVVHIPDLPLVPGHYWVALIVRDPLGTRKGSLIDSLDRAGSFEVVGTESDGHMAIGRPSRTGFLFLDSTWEVHSNGTLAAATAAART